MCAQAQASIYYKPRKRCAAAGLHGHAIQVILQLEILANDMKAKGFVDDDSLPAAMFRLGMTPMVKASLWVLQHIYRL